MHRVLLLEPFVPLSDPPPPPSPTQRDCREEEGCKERNGEVKFLLTMYNGEVKFLLTVCGLWRRDGVGGSLATRTCGSVLLLIFRVQFGGGVDGRSVVP